ncbi:MULTISPECIES: NADase-type glycan-binding domain-containing protein [unclassified Streptomyces]|uniref:NADase-type glycan-binding domain-containing protein n=1 Tax=unclassified Streptomyces TaxID=2593676 RepID=UPI0038268DA3
MAAAPDAAPDDEDATPTLPVRTESPETAESPEAAAERARALLVPVADPEQRAAPEPSVAPVLPGRAAAARPQVQAPGAEPDEEGGVPCPWCSTGNRPDRHFCRRCAMSLSDRPGVPEARPPWWRRILNFGDRPAPWAGDRPRLRRNLGRILTWAVWALVVALVVTAAFNTGAAVNAVRDHFAERAPVSPDFVEASHSYTQQEPALAFDKLNNTWWGPGLSESGEGEWIEARFLQPTRLLDVIITPGVSTQTTDLAKSARPKRIEAVITTKNNETITRFLDLNEGSGAQRRTFRVADATVVRFILRSAYGAAADKQVAIAEIEFFGRSKSN